MSKEFSMSYLRPIRVKLSLEACDIVAPNYSMRLLPDVNEEASIQNYQSTNGGMDPYKLIVSSEVTSVIFISKYGEEQRPGGPTLTKVAYSMMDWFSDSGEEIPMVIELDKNFRN